MINDQALRPDLTLVLDVDPAIAAERRAARGNEGELYEQLELQRRVRAQYGKLARVRPHDRIESIDASQPAGEVHAQVIAIVSSIL